MNDEAKKQLAKPQLKFAEIVTGAEADGIDHEVGLDEIGNQPPPVLPPEAQILHNHKSSRSRCLNWLCDRRWCDDRRYQTGLESDFKSVYLINQYHLVSRQENIA